VRNIRRNVNCNRNTSPSPQFGSCYNCCNLHKWSGNVQPLARMDRPLAHVVYGLMRARTPARPTIRTHEARPPYLAPHFSMLTAPSSVDQPCWCFVIYEIIVFPRDYWLASVTEECTVMRIYLSFNHAVQEWSERPRRRSSDPSRNWELSAVVLEPSGTMQGVFCR